MWPCHKALAEAVRDLRAQKEARSARPEERSQRGGTGQLGGRVSVVKVIECFGLKMGSKELKSCKQQQQQEDDVVLSKSFLSCCYCKMMWYFLKQQHKSLKKPMMQRVFFESSESTRQTNRQVVASEQRPKHMAIRDRN